jgi:hypothetical protein
MQTITGRLQRAAAAVALGLALCAPGIAMAQAAISPDAQVRAAQQWEDVLLLQAFDYLQVTPAQLQEMQPLADYARTRLDEVEQLRARLRQAIQDQHQAAMKGHPPSNSDQQDVIQKQRQIVDRQESVAREIVERIAPKLAALLTRKQTVRAWILVQNHLPPAEPKRVALTDPTSGFVLPQLQARDVIEEMVKANLRQAYAPDVIEAALTPWEFTSLAGLFGGATPFGGQGGAPPVDRAKALQGLQDVDPQMGQRMLSLVQKMMKPFTGGADSAAPPPPAVAPEVRAAINRDAAAIRKRIEADPEAFLAQAGGAQMQEALRPLARRLFLSPRLNEALVARSEALKQ